MNDRIRRRGRGGARTLITCLATLLLAIGGFFSSAYASSITTLYAFGTQDNSAEYPLGAIQASDGNLYGVSLGGGAFDCGVIYKSTLTGLVTELHFFSSLSSPYMTVFEDGCGPGANLIQGNDGRLYGTTSYGGGTGCGGNGCGTVFGVALDGSGYEVLHTFIGGATDGASPEATLTQGSDGNLYGTTNAGGANKLGTLFKLATDGSGFLVLHNFAGGSSDGASPLGNGTLIQGSDGNLYGVTGSGGGTGCNGDGCGVIFKSATNGAGYSLVHVFVGGSADGAAPFQFIQGIDGNLYGTTADGGSGGGTKGCVAELGCGTVYKVSTEGTGFAILHAFAGGGSDGSAPTTIMQFSSGTLYGTANAGGSSNCMNGSDGCGVVFELATNGGNYSVLYDFAGGASSFDGTNPDSLILGNDGNFYGAASTSTKITNSCFGGCGALFQLSPSGSDESVVVSFGTHNDAYLPIGSVTQGGNGNLYGTTTQGGGGGLCGTGCGATYSLATDGSAYAELLKFTGPLSDGEHPAAPLVLGNDGNFYGTTPFGGTKNQNSAICSGSACGTVFRTVPGSTNDTVLYTFVGGSDGAEPYSGLIQDQAGNFYGTTSEGGGSGCGGVGCGTVFKIAAGASSDEILHVFTGGSSDGAVPYFAKLVLGNDGRLYGTTTSGGGNGCGGNGCGTAFKLATDGSAYSILHIFGSGNTDGTLPGSAIIQGADGNLYGTTSQGGAAEAGTVFKLSIDGSLYSVLHSFSASGGDGANPIGALMQGTDSNLYGTTASGGGTGCNSLGCGTVFGLATDGSGYTVIHSFTGTSDGADPEAALIQAADGNLYGTTQYGGSLGVGTVFRPTVSPPGTPGNLKAGSANGSVTLTWSASSGLASYSVYEGTTSGGESATALKSGIAGTSFSISGLTGGTQYFFTVKASNVGGSSAASNEASVTPLAQPTGLVATPGFGQISLTWNAAAGATSYNVYEGTTAGGESGTPVQTGIAGTNTTITGLSNGSTYYFKVAGVSTSGTSALSNEAGATTSASLPAPTNLNATAGTGQVSLSWTASTGASDYYVYYGTTSGQESIKSAAITGTSTAITGLSGGTTYYFVVKAYNHANGLTSVASNEASATTVLPAPTGLQATPGGAGAVTLNWTGVSGASDYYVYYGTTSGNETTKSAAVTGTATTITGLSNVTTYYFVVKAYSHVSGVTSAASNEVSATTGLPAPTGLQATVSGTGQVALNWTGVGGASDYYVYYGTTSGNETTKSAAVTGTATTITGLSNVTTYYFVVKAYSHVSGVTSAASNEVSATTGLPAPTGLQATVNGTGQVTLNWTGVGGASDYYVFFGTTSGNETSKSAAVTSTSSTITGLSSGTTYYFVVKAYSHSSGLTSAASNEVSATPN